MPPPEFSPNQFGGQAPQQSSAIARFLGYARAVVPGIIVSAIFLFAAEILFAPQYKPTYLIGTFLGHVETAEIGAKQEAALAYARGMADAQAQAQATAQKQVEINRQQQQVIADSLAAKASMSNMADIACAASSFFQPFSQYAGYGDSLRQGCGAGERFRENIIREQQKAGSAGTGTTIAGASPPPTTPLAPEVTPYRRPYDIPLVGSYALTPDPEPGKK